MALARCSMLSFVGLAFACTDPVAGAVDAGAAGNGDAGASVDAAGGLADARPGAVDGGTAERFAIFIAASNYRDYRDELLGYGPFIVYAWATDPALDNPARYDAELAALAAIDDPDVTELIMFSSHRTLGDKLAAPGHADHLREIGVTGFGFNSEGFMTPADEMNSLGDGPATNAVARFAALADAEGFATLWGPIRVTADAVGDAAVDGMYGAGLDGIALQEQRFIEEACVDERAAAVAATAARYRARAAAAGVSTRVDVQLMPSRCLAGDDYAATRCGATIAADFDHCAAFVEAIEADIDAIAIWASGPEDRAGLVPLVRRLRAE